LAGPARDRKPLIVDGAWLCQQRLLHHEDRLVAELRTRRAAAPAPLAGDAAAALADVLRRPPVLGGQAMTLSAEQEAAVRAALAGPLTLITGGPGTGKTSI